MEKRVILMLMALVGAPVSANADVLRVMEIPKQERVRVDNISLEAAVELKKRQVKQRAKPVAKTPPVPSRVLKRRVIRPYAQQKKMYGLRGRRAYVNTPIFNLSGGVNWRGPEIAINVKRKKFGVTVGGTVFVRQYDKGWKAKLGIRGPVNLKIFYSRSEYAKDKNGIGMEISKKIGGFYLSLQGKVEPYRHIYNKETKPRWGYHALDGLFRLSKRF